MRLPSASRGIPASRLIAEAAVPSLGFPGSPAFRAPLRFILEPLFLVESLLAFSKDELLVAILANQCFVGHNPTSWSFGFNWFGLNSSFIREDKEVSVGKLIKSLGFSVSVDTSILYHVSLQVTSKIWKSGKPDIAADTKVLTKPV